ncbi:MAG: hypothetical protein IKG42_05415 [Clostridia bacterium]|nr:hypothetical protein [Clostridia bacterium]
MFISKFRDRKGITLIALVITIIVLLILAGVTIAMVVGDNGILSRSREAKDTTNIKKIQEEVDLEAADLVAEYHSKDNGQVPSTAGEYVAVQINEKTVNGIEIKADESTMKITASKDGITVEGIIQDDGHIEWYDENSTVAGGGSGAGNGETGGGSETTNEPRDTAIESALTEKLASSTASERLIEVSYNPQGTYSWNKELATSDRTGTDTLSSGEGGSFIVNTWRVLDVDTTTGTVRLVPKNYASGTVRFQGAQGYNNAVKLLNDACSALYSDSDAGATAKSINIDDIEDIMETLPTEATAPTQLYSAYDSSNSKYPVIYGNENKAVINGGDSISNGLGLSQQTSFIQRSEGTSETNTLSGSKNDIGAITTATSIRPYHTYYSKDNSSFTTALGNKSGIILPNGSSTDYWVASRCVNTSSGNCLFNVRYVYGGDLRAGLMFRSDGKTDYYSRALFPVVSLSSGHLTANATGTGYTVE